MSNMKKEREKTQERKQGKKCDKNIQFRYEQSLIRPFTLCVLMSSSFAKILFSFCFFFRRFVLLLSISLPTSLHPSSIGALKYTRRLNYEG